MQIVFLVTNKPYVHCGVVDYTKQLVLALNEAGASASMEVFSRWSFSALFQLWRKYAKRQDVVLHLQYPTLGMGNSPSVGLLPFLFSKNRLFITLHEFEHFNPIRKLCFLFFRLLANSIIITNSEEQRHLDSFFFWGHTATTVIPIGNNIQVENQGEKPASPRLVYFGQVGPNKGVDLFLETVRMLREKQNHIDCAIIGALLDSESSLAKEIERASSKLGIQRIFNASASEVSYELSRSTIAFLPFPDGVSDKRGSALACLKHGLAVITKHSSITPIWWRKTTYGIQSAEEACSVIEQIITAKDAPASPSPSLLSQALAEREWPSIAEKHLLLYQDRRSFQPPYHTETKR